MKFKRIIFGAIALSIFVSCGNKQEEAQKSAAEYPTAVIEKQTTTLESSFPANVKGQEDIEIRPRIDGFIDKIYVDEGSIVKKGDRLFSIDSPQSVQNLNTALAAVVAADAQVQTAQLNVDRIKPLADEGIVSEVQHKTYVNALATAKASLAQAHAQEKNARSVLGWTTVTSPVDGIAGSIPFRLGSLVSSGNVLTTVANTKEVYVYFSIAETVLMDILSGLEGANQQDKIKNFPPVKLRLKDGSIHENGKISTIGGQTNATTGSTLLRADFPNAERIIRSGFSGRIIIPVNLEDAIVIPQKATFTQQDKFIAYKVVADSVTNTLIEVTPTPDGQSYVVNKGLNVGDRIVIDGVATLRNGMKIKAN